MKFSKIVTFALFVVLVLILMRNFQYLYVAPIQNAYWWSSDETWLMSQYHQFVTTGHYVNPNAPGSMFSQCSGLLFGSCYVTAAMYGLPLLLIKHHTVDVGRTITFLLALLTLFSIWLIAKRYGVAPWLRMYGCILLASTLGFFIMSHAARYDLLVGFVVLIVVALLPLMIEKYSDLSVLLGLAFPSLLLLNGHLIIYLFLVLAYFSFVYKPKWKVFFASMTSGFLVLFVLQVVLLHSVSIFGPLSDGLNKIPMLMIIHPKSDFANLYWRYFIANMWARNILFLSIAMILLFLLARVKYKVSFSNALTITEKRLAIGLALLILSSVFLEDVVTPRYFIHVLPALVFMLMIMISFLFRASSNKVLTMSVVLLIGVFSVYDYSNNSAAMGQTGEVISRENQSAITDALRILHSHANKSIPRVFCTASGQATVMDDDSCALVTTIMYNQPIDNLPASTLWKNANIDYAIKYSGNWSEKNSYIDTSTHPRIIFERAGHFTDYERTYDPSGLKALDTLRVYEYR
ncbi:MAG TPA: hypothetical protein VFH95_04930 [Candidatus Kapabacteria bacterium]|nr:hypothetical protein [Candidatus Kapabacteria bacterium]